MLAAVLLVALAAVTQAQLQSLVTVSGADLLLNPPAGGSVLINNITGLVNTLRKQLASLHATEASLNATIAAVTSQNAYAASLVQQLQAAQLSGQQEVLANQGTITWLQQALLLAKAGTPVCASVPYCQTCDPAGAVCATCLGLLKQGVAFLHIRDINLFINLHEINLLI